MTTPQVERRTFLARVLGALGGAWLAKELGAPATAAASTPLGGDAPYLGEIRMFAGDFEPWGWRFCDGRLLAIEEYDLLYSLLGTTYGGDGQTSFGLPDLRGRAPIHVGTTQRGELLGQEAVILTPAQIPSHNHNLQGSAGLGVSDDPTGRVPAKNGLGSPHYAANADTPLASTAMMFSGAFEGHNNMMPSLCVHFIICVESGIVPPP